MENIVRDRGNIEGELEKDRERDRTRDRERYKRNPRGREQLLKF
jgi:hypothetical protein